MSSKRPPSGRLILSSSTDGEKKKSEVARPGLDDCNSNVSSASSPEDPAKTINVSGRTPSSVLRSNHRGGGSASKSSVAFSEVNNIMDYTNSPSPASSIGNAAPTPASTSAASSTAAAASVAQRRRLPVSSLTSTSSLVTSRPIITLERVVSSQFENEAETHILAALEMEDMREGQRGGDDRNINNHQYYQSQLLGEGIERGMEDYSDDEDDHAQQESQQASSRSRTWSNDSFLKNVSKQNDLPQYQIRLPGPEVEYRQEQQHQQQQQVSQPTTTQLQPQPPQLKRYISENLPPIDENHLAMHIERENYEDGGGGGEGHTSLFVEAAKQVNSSDATPVAAALHIVGDGNESNGIGINDMNNAAQQRNDNSHLKGDAAKDGSGDTDGSEGGGSRDRIERGGGGTGAGGGSSTATTSNVVDGVNTMTDVTDTTDNMNFMANRLRALQGRRSGLQRKPGSLNFNGMGISSRSNASSSDDSSSSIMGHETSGDKLIDALNSVDSSKNKSFLSKIRSEYTELIVPKLPIFRRNIAHILLYMVIPSLAVAAVLFYMFDNPMGGDTGASVSWWIIFVAVRQPIIFELTLVGEVFWVEIFALRSKLFNRAVGPYISLAFIQSRGW